MIDLALLKLKIDDLKSKVANDSITPIYLGTLLDEFLTDLEEMDDAIKKYPVTVKDTSQAKLIIKDDQGNSLLTVDNDGNLISDAFDSAATAAEVSRLDRKIDNIQITGGGGSSVHPVTVGDTDQAKLIIADESQRPILTVTNSGHIRTDAFDSRNAASGGGSADDVFFLDASRRSQLVGSVPLVIICGQSNADGRAPASSAPSWLSANGYKVSGYKMWSNSGEAFADYSVTSNNGADAATGSDGTGVGNFSFDPFFAKAYIDEFGAPLYAIRQTMGGISIQGQPTSGRRPWTWQPRISAIVQGCNSMCLALMQKYRAAQAWAEAQGLRLCPVAVLWHQGETDADYGYLDQYSANVKNVISWIRGVTGISSLPWITATVQDGYAQSYHQLNQIITQLPLEVPHLGAVDMAGHYTSIDGLHYDSSALQYMGSKMLEIYKDIITN